LGVYTRQENSMENINSQKLHRRAYQRYFMEASATLIDEENRQIPSILNDLSSKGAGVISRDPFQVRDRIGLVIRAPFFFDGPIQRKAVVAWCNKIDNNLWQIGLDFGLNQISLDQAVNLC
jgi:hypothetical protein